MGFEKVFVMHVHMGRGEWSTNVSMLGIAAEYFNEPVKKFMAETGIPLVVEVYEHAGWWLGYTLIDGQVQCIASANDMAVWNDKQKEFRLKAYKAKWESAGTHRRAERVEAA